MKCIVYIYLFFIPIFCFSSRITKAFVKEDYNKVIQIISEKLLKGNATYNDVMKFDKAYKLANSKNFNRIKYLSSHNISKHYEELILLYKQLKVRQNLISRVIPIDLGDIIIDYGYVDYDIDIVFLKNKALYYYYNEGVNLLDNAHSKKEYIKSYQNLKKQKVLMTVLYKICLFL